VEWLNQQPVAPQNYCEPLVASCQADEQEGQSFLKFLSYPFSQLGLSEEVEEIHYYGSVYRLSLRQKLLRAAQKSKET